MSIRLKLTQVLLLSITFLGVGISCTNETDLTDLVTTENIDYTDEMLEKIAYGCNSYIDNELTDEKLETTAPEEYIALIEDRVSTLKSSRFVEYTYNASQQYVGVIEVNGCGKYKNYNEIIINYDSENRNNKNKLTNFVGAWTGSENITMRFCLVPYDSFGRTGEWYGVMNFSELDNKSMLSSTKSQGILHALMDAEDHNDNKTNMRFNNYQGTGSWSESKIGNVNVDNSGNLNFQMIIFEPGDWSEPMYSYPDFGFDYGVFGTLRPYVFNDFKKYKEDYGKSYSDDEDNNNANWIKYNGISVKNTNFHNIIEMNKNTTFYISRVKSKLKDNM
ncbi:MAG: hypothetical protein HUJ96_07540 [Marinilabiliaceae bacterium]|nr:hypothetical protein [Marinilabiliaceae bacterium]